MEKIRLKPLGSRLIVKPITKKETTKSGIILTSTDDGELNRGEVLEIGEIDDIKVGDKILFEKYGADEYKLDNEKFLVVDYSKVIGIIK